MFDKTNWQGMREDRPLDALFPELQGFRPEAQEQSGPDLWSSVLEVELESTWQWALASWSAPEDSTSFIKTLGRLVKRTIAQEWSKPPGYGGASGRQFEGFMLFCFEPLTETAMAQMSGLGFERHYAYDPDHYRSRLSILGEQANEHGWKMPVQPAQLWWAPLHQADEAMQKLFKTVQSQMIAALGSRVWGQTPGEPSKAMASSLEQLMQIKFSPDLETLHELDMILIDRSHSTLRWMPPMLFQGLCDFIGIVAMAKLGKNVQWATCSPDGYGGYYEPALRIVTPKGPKDIEIGLMLYDLVAAPLLPDQHSILLRDWVQEHF